MNRTPQLTEARNLFIYADAARGIVRTDQADDALDLVCDRLLRQLILAPIRGRTDAAVKVWLLQIAAERDWDYDYCARTVLGQLGTYVWRRCS